MYTWQTALLISIGSFWLIKLKSTLKFAAFLSNWFSSVFDSCHHVFRMLVLFQVSSTSLSEFYLFSFSAIYLIVNISVLILHKLATCVYYSQVFSFLKPASFTFLLHFMQLPLPIYSFWFKFDSCRLAIMLSFLCFIDRPMECNMQFFEALLVCFLPSNSSQMIVDCQNPKRFCVFWKENAICLTAYLLQEHSLKDLFFVCCLLHLTLSLAYMILNFILVNRHFDQDQSNVQNLHPLFE